MQRPEDPADAPRDVAATPATVEVVAVGGLATVQDRGRPGWRRVGLPAGGALDPTLLAVAQALAGMPGDAPAIEFFGAGPTFKALDTPVLLGLAGDFPATWLGADGLQRALASWRSVWLQPGEALRLGAPRGARAGVVAVHGLQVERVLGSASTFLRARLGGFAGRALAPGDRLRAVAPLPQTRGRLQRVLRRPPVPVAGPVRVVLGPQADHFDAAALETFLSTGWTVTAEADRMGVRLAGPVLAHNARGREIVSDATVPGSIQVPGNGQPLVLLADGQTAGGYPKIATVASADLARLALAPAGSVLRFQAVTVAGAEALAREHAAARARLLAAIEPLALDGDADLQALYEGNLVSGMIDALA
jgi:allophanate hydrolase